MTRGFQRSTLRCFAIATVLSLCTIPAARGAPSRSEALKLMRSGDQLLAEGRHQEAERAYRGAIAADPSLVTAYGALATHLLRKRAYADAVELLRRAVKRNEKYAEGWYSLAYALRKSRRYDAALTAYRRFSKLRPSSADPYYGIGLALKAKGRTREAARAFLKYARLERDPQRQRWVVRARQLAEKLAPGLSKNPAPASKQPAAERNRTAKRQAAKRQAAERQAAKRQVAKRQAAKRQAAKRQAAKRQAAERQAAARRTAARQTRRSGAAAGGGGGAGGGSRASSTPGGVAAPDDSGEGTAERRAARKHKERGDQLARAGRKHEAVKAYRRAIATDFTYTAAYNALGNALFSLRRHDEAVRVFRVALRDNPDYAFGWYNLAYALRKAGRNREAVAAYRMFAKKRPKDPDPHYGLALTFRAMGDKQGAIDAFNRYISMESRGEQRSWVERAKRAVVALGGTPATPGSAAPARTVASAARAKSGDQNEAIGTTAATKGNAPQDSGKKPDRGGAATSSSGKALPSDILARAVNAAKGKEVIKSGSAQPAKTDEQKLSPRERRRRKLAKRREERKRKREEAKRKRAEARRARLEKRKRLREERRRKREEAKRKRAEARRARLEERKRKREERRQKREEAKRERAEARRARREERERKREEAKLAREQRRAAKAKGGQAKGDEAAEVAAASSGRQAVPAVAPAPDEPAPIPAPAAPKKRGDTEAARLRIQGDELAREGKCHGARASYRRALEVDPFHTRAYDGVAYCSYKLRTFDAGIRALGIALRDNPEYTAGYLHLARLRAAAGAHAAAAGTYRRYLDAKPGDLDARFELARSLRRSGENQQAIAAYQTFLTRDRRDLAAAQREAARRELRDLGGKLPGAVAEAKKKRELSPRERRRLARLERRKKRREARERRREEAKRKREERRLARLERRRKRREARERRREEAKRKREEKRQARLAKREAGAQKAEGGGAAAPSPAVAMARSLATDLDAALGRPAKVRRDKSKASSSGPAAALAQIGDRQFAGQRYVVALGLYRQAAKLDPAAGDALYKAGVCAIALRQMRLAAKLFGQLVKREPENAPARTNLRLARAAAAGQKRGGRAAALRSARALEAKGHHAEAEQQLTRLARRAPNPRVFVLRARVRLARKKPRAALLDAGRALALQPGRASPLRVLGDAHREIGDKQRALRYYRRFLERLRSKRSRASKKARKQVERAIAELSSAAGS